MNLEAVQALGVAGHPGMGSLEAVVRLDGLGTELAEELLVDEGGFLGNEGVIERVEKVERSHLKVLEIVDSSQSLDFLDDFHSLLHTDGAWVVETGLFDGSKLACTLCTVEDSTIRHSNSFESS